MTSLVRYRSFPDPVGIGGCASIKRSLQTQLNISLVRDLPDCVWHVKGVKSVPLGLRKNRNRFISGSGMFPYLEGDYHALFAPQPGLFLPLSYYFSIKWLIPFYHALIAQAASGGEKCMDYVF